jgi:tight adherence protein C
MPMLLLFASFFVGAAVFLVTEAASAPSRERRRALGRAKDYGRVHVPDNQMAAFRQRVILPAMQRLARLALRVNPRVTHEMITMQLLSAGLSRKINANGFLAAKGLLGVAGAFFGLTVGTSSAGPLAGLAFALAAGAIGFIAPGIVVSMRIRQRREELRTQLPDALDLLAVSVEAGLGFDGAITKLTEHTEGALTEELELTLSEMRIGESRHEALKKLADRAAAPEIAHFSRAIVQADQLGISLGRILKVQAVDQRNRRQAAAEEKAMKAPIKMLFPLVLFVFPAMFVVILGPAFLNLDKIF